MSDRDTILGFLESGELTPAVMDLAITGNHGPIPGLDLARELDVAAGASRCRICGCTDSLACPGGCWWVADGLCSTCYASGAAQD